MNSKIKSNMIAAAMPAGSLSLPAQAYNDDLPETFDSYFWQKADMNQMYAGSLAAPFFDAWFWYGNPIDSEHDYYVPPEREFNTPWWNGPTATNWTFQGRSLVVAGKFRQLEHWNLTAITFPKLYWLGGAYIYFTNDRSPLQGNVHVRRSSEQNPVRHEIKYDFDAKQPYAVALEGDADQYIRFTRAEANRGASGVEFRGDLSAYYGTMEVRGNQHLRLNGVMPGSVRLVAENAWLENCGTDTLTLGAAELLDVSTVRADAGQVISIGALTIAPTACLSVGYAKPDVGLCGKIVVTDSLDFNGSIRVNVANMPTELIKTFRDAELMRVDPAALPEGGLELKDFKIESIPNIVGVEAVLRNDSDGGKTLVIRSYDWITHNKVGSSTNGQPYNSFASPVNANGENFWSNGLTPDTDPDAAKHAYVHDMGWEIYLPQCETIYEFPAPMLICSSPLYSFGKNAGFRGHLVLNTSSGTYGVAGVSETGTDPEYGATRNVQRFQGRVSLPSANVMSWQTKYGDAMVVWESEIEGPGGMNLTTYANAYDRTSNQGWYEFTGTNVNWKGKVHLTQTYERTKYGANFTPNWDVNVRLIIRDGRNLGGKLDAFAADALFIENYARLLIRDDVTLAGDLNRGIKVGDVGRFWQPQGKTLTINQPITLAGMMVKEGPGTMVLASSEIVTSDGLNRIVVTNGALKVTNPAAADGAAISFSPDATLLVDAAATTHSTLRSVKVGSSITSSALEGKIPVSFSGLPESDGKTSFNPVICTSKDGTLAFRAKHAKRYSIRILRSDADADGIYTYSADIRPTGFCVYVH